MINPKKYRVIKAVTIQGTDYSVGVEVRLEQSLVESGNYVADGFLELIEPE